MENGTIERESRRAVNVTARRLFVLSQRFLEVGRHGYQEHSVHAVPLALVLEHDEVLGLVVLFLIGAIAYFQLVFHALFYFQIAGILKVEVVGEVVLVQLFLCLLYTSPSPRDRG